MANMSHNTNSNARFLRLFSVCIVSTCVNPIWSFQVIQSPLISKFGAKSVSSSSSFAKSAVASSSLQTTRTTAKGEALTDWSFLDAIYLITCPNADPNSERLNRAKRTLTDMGLLADQIHIKEFETDDEDRIRGCYKSHISVLKDALKDMNVGGGQRNNWWEQILTNNVDTTATKKKKNILILEDNLDFSGTLDQSILNSVNDFMNQNDEWDTIQLSYIPYVPNLIVSRTDNSHIVKLDCGVGSALGTTAYIINEFAISRLLNEDATKGYYCAIPDAMALLFPNSRFGAYPTPFVRAPKTKSLVNPQLDDLRSLLFQPAVNARMHDLLVWTGASSNALFFACLGTLILLTLLSGRMTLNAISELLWTGSYKSGNIWIAVLSSIFSTASLAVIVQGCLLAPKPPDTKEEQTLETSM